MNFFLLGKIFSFFEKIILVPNGHGKQKLHPFCLLLSHSKYLFMLSFVGAHFEVDNLESGCLRLGAEKSTKQLYLHPQMDEIC